MTRKKYLFVISPLILIIAVGAVILLCKPKEQSPNNNDIPTMTVLYGQSSYQAMQGGYSWTFNKGDGTFEAVIADSMHPRDAMDYMPKIPFVITTMSHIDPLLAYLKFDRAPDKIRAQAWYINDIYNEACEIKISANEEMENGAQFKLSLEEEPCIYEITAQWNEEDGSGGVVFYCFYTENSIALSERGEIT